MKPKARVILVIRDGWGYSSKKKNNAIASSKTLVNDYLMKNYPNTLLDCSGEAVGLKKGFQGNSEVGHMTIGSGRIIYQSMKKIDDSIKNKSFFKKKAFLEAIQNAKKNNSYVHLIGLFQIEGVHSHISHLEALLDLCKKKNFKRVKIHAITDGRDAPVKDSLKHLKRIEKKIKKIGFGEIVTVTGRYYSMDRDKRWDRTRKSFECIVRGNTKIVYENVLTSIRESHSEGITDEFIEPRKKKEYNGFEKNDSIIFFNYRTDRPRQLTRAITEKMFSFKKSVFFVAMTNYYSPMKAMVAFDDEKPKNFLGEIISKKGLKQLRISETEKYAHVTFFFNGQVEKKYKGEERILVPSPKEKTYDLVPEMSAYKITKTLEKEIKKRKHAFIVVNLVNCDMVGHTAKLSAIKKAIETVDECTGQIVKKGLENGYEIMVFADHGNAESQDTKTITSHTTNKVPFILVSEKEEYKKCELKKGKGLKDIAPTVLYIMGFSVPEQMTGKNLIIKK